MAQVVTEDLKYAANATVRYLVTRLQRTGYCCKIAIRVFNMTGKHSSFSPKSSVCQITETGAIDKQASDLKLSIPDISSPVSDLGIPIDTQNLTSAQVLKVKQCLIFLDDILIFSGTFDEHIQRLEAVFGRFAKYGLKLKPAKEKIIAVTEWPTHKNVKELGFSVAFFTVGTLNDLLKGHSTNGPTGKNNGATNTKTISTA
ncbi:hypothetical protein CHS0354_005649 [Potamilus streckersoni]|uniref:Reverse transcriptase domain-containing protein n=1 Tax=Potamilus streckersoni TaxID=2493646 RepID=A0AAE0S0K3_9BIVA|nr:hypothetical protein CHS0354_005649 [Potamilus streckersoni]